MKRMMAVFLIAAIVFAGCAKKPVEKSEIAQERQFLMAGTVFLKQGDVVKAIQSFAAAIKVAPDNFEGYYLLSETLIRLKQFTQAEAILIAAVKRFPDNGVAYYLLSVAHQNTGNLVPAIVAARRSVELLAASGDKEGQQRAMILLAAEVTEAKKLNDDKVAQDTQVATQQAAEEARKTAAGQ